MSTNNRLRIDKLLIEGFRTKESRDPSGKLVRERIAVKVARRIAVIDGGGRFFHAFVDLLIINTFGLILQIVVWGISLTSPFFLYLLTSFFFSFFSFILRPVYYALCEAIWQSTPGKMIFGRVVINQYAEKPEATSIIIRSLVRLIPFEAFSCFSERGWHDTWTDTWVVHKSEAAALADLRQKQETEIVEKWKADWDDYNRKKAEGAKL